jgi:hypothetical protein
MPRQKLATANFARRSLQLLVDSWGARGMAARVAPESSPPPGAPSPLLEAPHSAMVHGVAGRRDSKDVGTGTRSLEPSPTAAAVAADSPPRAVGLAKQGTGVCPSSSNPTGPSFPSLVLDPAYPPYTFLVLALCNDPGSVGALIGRVPMAAWSQGPAAQRSHVWQQSLYPTDHPPLTHTPGPRPPRVRSSGQQGEAHGSWASGNHAARVPSATGGRDHCVGASTELRSIRSNGPQTAERRPHPLLPREHVRGRGTSCSPAPLPPCPFVAGTLSPRGACRQCSWCARVRTAFMSHDRPKNSASACRFKRGPPAAGRPGPCQCGPSLPYSPPVSCAQVSPIHADAERQ